jgi:uncharacterized protein YecT (DUF1311 family)
MKILISACLIFNASTAYAQSGEPLASVYDSREPAPPPESHSASLNRRLGLSEKFHQCIKNAGVTITKEWACLDSERIKQRTRLEKAHDSLMSLLTKRKQEALASAHKRWLQDVPDQCAIISGLLSTEDKKNRILNCVVYEYAKRSLDYEGYLQFKDSVTLWGEE